MVMMIVEKRSAVLGALIVCFICPLQAYHYLIIGGDGGGSHYYVASSIGRELAHRGHNITVLVSDMYANEAYERDADLFNYQIYKSLVTTDQFKAAVAEMAKVGMTGDYSSIFRINAIAESILRDQCESILMDMSGLNRLRQQKIDLIIGDLFYICVGLVAEHLDVPFITLTPQSIMSIQSQINYSPTNPAYIPDMITGLDTNLNFMERVANTLMVSFNSIMNRRMLSTFDEFKVKYNIHPETTTFKTLGKAELWFINSHFAIDFPRPLMPNAIPVGGLTTKPAEPLPKDLELYMTNSENGVIIFSLGSYVSITDQAMAEMFGEAFSQIPQRVIWKRKGKVPETIPPNVKVEDWIPQNDLLGHPNTRLLIYQCGINGVYEAVYHGVPIICIPVFFDQFDNAQRVASKGLGLRLDLPTLTSQQLLMAIHTVLNEERFRQNVSRISNILRDVPRTPSQRAADWSEFVVRHGGAQHLRSAAHDLSFIQYHLLDVWAFLLGIIVTCIGLLIMCCRCGVHLVCSSRKDKRD